jgi:hypothetical protein
LAAVAFIPYTDLQQGLMAFVVPKTEEECVNNFCGTRRYAKQNTGMNCESTFLFRTKMDTLKFYRYKVNHTDTLPTLDWLIIGQQDPLLVCCAANRVLLLWQMKR